MGKKTTGTHTTIKSVIHCSLLLDRELIEKIPDADKCVVENKYICIAFTTEQCNDANFSLLFLCSPVVRAVILR